MKRLGKIGIGAYVLFSIFFLQANVELVFDDYLSDHAKQCVYDHSGQKDIMADSLSKSAQVMQECPGVKDVSIMRNEKDDLEISVMGARPHACINEIYVLNQNGQILDANLYSHPKRLPSVQTIDSNSDLSPICKKFLLDIPYELLAEYSVLYHDPSNIILYDKKQPFFTVTCSVTAPPNQLIHEACKKIKGSLKNKGELGDEPLSIWNADIRFDKQIIVSKK
jgi:hypothetical protein